MLTYRHTRADRGNNNLFPGRLGRGSHDGKKIMASDANAGVPDHVERFNELPRATREWLETRRKDDWDRIDRALEFYERLQAREDKIDKALETFNVVEQVVSQQAESTRNIVRNVEQLQDDCRTQKAAKMAWSQLVETIRYIVLAAGAIIGTIGAVLAMRKL